MKPMEANQEMQERLTELNDIFQRGQRAKEFVETEYWGQLLEILQEKIKSHNEAKEMVDPLLYKVGYTIKKQDGSTYHKSGDEILMEAVAAEAEARVIKDIINMVMSDVHNGPIAHAEMENIRSKK